MSNVINLAEERQKKIFTDAGLDTNNMLICFNGQQLADLVNSIFLSGKKLQDIITENKDLYKVGYYDENTNKIHVLL